MNASNPTDRGAGAEPICLTDQAQLRERSC